MIIYDCEILNAIPDGEPLPGITYCNGWGDFKGMGMTIGTDFYVMPSMIYRIRT